MGLMRSPGMGTRAGIRIPLKLNDSYRRPSYCTQDVSSIGPISTVGRVYSFSSNGRLPGKRWNLKCSRPLCQRLCVAPCGAGSSASVNRSTAITGGLQVPIQMSNTTLDMGCTVMVMAGAYMLVSIFDVLTKSKILDQVSPCNYCLEFFCMHACIYIASLPPLQFDRQTETQLLHSVVGLLEAWLVMSSIFLENMQSEQKLSRKLVHISSGLLFMMSWPLFSASTDARYLAAFVPLANFVRLLIYGLALAKNEGLVKAVSRDGNPKELLRGPLYYVMALLFCTLVFWRESPIGVVSLAMMCGGDGIADIVGRRFGRLKLPYNQDKSWAGSISMFLFGLLISLGVLYYFSVFGFILLDWATVIQSVAIISMSATIVESLPVTQLLDDNISVPLTSIFVGLYLFPA